MVQFISSGLSIPAPAVFPFGSTYAAPPPSRPAAPGALGGYCLKAVCVLQQQEAEPRDVAKWTGFDTKGDIAERVERACHIRKKKTQRCSEVQLTMLPSRRDLACTGQIVFEFCDGRKSW